MKTPLKVIRKDYPRIRERVKGNTISYEVDCRNKLWKGQQYFSFQTKAEAIDKAKEVVSLLGTFGPANVPHEDIRLLASIRGKLAPFGLDPETAIDKFIKEHLANVALLDSEPLAKVSAKYLTDKTHNFKRPLAPKTLIGIKTTCNALEKCFGEKPIGTIAAKDVEHALERHWKTNSSRKDFLSRFRTFFKWAMGEKYITANPCGTKDKGDAIKVYAKKPDTLILPREDILTLLGQVLNEPQMVPFYALSMFAGLREAEAKRIGWNHIYLDERKTVFVSKQFAKTAADRSVKVHDNLIEWLKPFVGQPIKTVNHRRLFDGVRKGIAWQRDIMRHTAVSYFMGKYKNVYEVAEWLGNSPAMIKKHYQVPLLEADVEWFWSLTPEKVKAEIEERKKKSRVAVSA